MWLAKTSCIYEIRKREHCKNDNYYEEDANIASKQVGPDVENPDVDEMDEGNLALLLLQYIYLVDIIEEHICLPDMNNSTKYIEIDSNALWRIILHVSETVSTRVNRQSTKHMHTRAL